MEKYDAILRLINEKIENQEGIIEMYRRESVEKDATIRELQQKNGDLELAYCDETQKNNELSTENEALRDEIVTLKKVIESLKAEVNNLANF